MKSSILKLLLLLLLLIGNVFIFQSSAVLTPDQDDEDTSTEDDEDTDTTDTEGEDEEDEDSDDDGIDDDIETAYEREVEVDENDREWKIKSQLKNGDQKDEFKVEFKVGGGDEPEIKMEYSSEAGSTESEMKYRVNFDELIEFTDDGVAGYSEDNDTMVSIYELDKAEWDAIVYSSEIVNGSTLHTATAQTSDGIFTLILKISTGFAQLNDTIITPNAIKIDIVIDSYDYQGNDTYLAMQTDIKTESETKVDEESEDEQDGFAANETQVSVNSASASGFFSWVEVADADGVEVDILSSNLSDSDEQDDDLEEGENQQIMFFTIDTLNPTKVVWDPKVGIDNDVLVQQQMSSTTASDQSSITSPSDPDGGSLPFPIWILVLSLALPVMIRRRR